MTTSPMPRTIELPSTSPNGAQDNILGQIHRAPSTSPEGGQDVPSRGQDHIAPPDDGQDAPSQVKTTELPSTPLQIMDRTCPLRSKP